MSDPQADSLTELQRLHRQAEELAEDAELNIQNYSPAELERLIYELQLAEIELKLQNEALLELRDERESIEQKYKDLYDFAPLGYFTLDGEGRIIEANLTGATMLRRSKAELLHQRLSKFVLPEDQNICHFYYEQLFKLSTLHDVELRMVKKDGAPFYARLLGQMVPEGEGNEPHQPCCYVTISDISHRKEIELSLAETRRRLRALFDQTQDAILLADGQARYVEVNPAACAMLGYSQEALLDLGVWDIMPETGKEEAQALWRDFIAAGQQQGEITVVHKDGRLIEADYRAVANIRPGLHLSVLRDITERKQAERERNRLLESLTQQREQLRSLSGLLTDLQEMERKALAQELHDRVGQNLTGLNLNLTFLQTKLGEILPDMPEAVRTALNDSLGLVEQTSERVQDVMTELRPPVLEDFGLIATLQWYADQLAQRDDYLAVTIRGDEPEPRLSKTLETTLFRIAQEALTNVIKHARAETVDIDVQADSLFAGFTITDDGVGFDITRWSDPTKRRSWGLLTMIERAEALSGYCHIETQLGQGTRIIVEIPR